MTGLDDQVRRWRSELEATLAFSEEEIDELEDHLRLSVGTKLRAGLAPMQAWQQASIDLGPASALAVEFAKAKLMPALGRLVFCWWPSLVLIFYFILCLTVLGPLQDKRPAWVMLPAAFLATWCLLPGKAQKNAVLVGTGVALGSLPLLHGLIYNGVTERLAGPGWKPMGAHFGWTPILLGTSAVILLPVWWARRHPLPAPERSGPLALAILLLVLLALAPILGETVIHLALRILYSLPDAHQLASAPSDVVYATNRVMEASLLAVLFVTANVLPLCLVLVGCLIVGTVRLMAGRDHLPAVPMRPAFPAAGDLPWFLVLAVTGAAWVCAHGLEISFSERTQEMARMTGNRPVYTGMETIVLVLAAVFLIGQHELTKRLRAASRLRFFYASLPIFAGLLVALCLPFLQPWPKSSDEPKVLSLLLELALVVLTGRYFWAFAAIYRRGALDVSLWKFDGGRLIELGLLMGLVIAGAGLALWLVALAMAEESVVMISALLAWGNSVHGVSQGVYHPQEFMSGEHLWSWLMMGPAYLAGCLTVGLVLVLLASALEFIRFNGFRLYRVRQARRSAVAVVAVED